MEDHSDGRVQLAMFSGGSPEGQTGKGIAKASEVYSLALVVSDLRRSDRPDLTLAASLDMLLEARDY